MPSFSSVLDITGWHVAEVVPAVPRPPYLFRPSPLGPVREIVDHILHFGMTSTPGTLKCRPPKSHEEILRLLRCFAISTSRKIGGERFTRLSRRS